MAEIRYTLADGTVLVDELDGITLADRCAFEEYFKVNSVAIDLKERRRAEHELAVEAALESKEQPPEPDPDIFVPTKWRLFCAWRRFRRKETPGCPGVFDDFIEAVVDDEFIDDQPEDKTGADAEQVDAPGTDDDGSGLDPTEQVPPPISPPASSSPESAGEAS